MIMTPRLRRFALAAHLTCSVGWIGAVAGYIALDVAAATSQDAQTLRAAYLDGVDRPVCHRPVGPRVVADRARHVPGNQVGLVSTLLGLDLTLADRDCHRRLANGNTDNQLLRRRSGGSH